jgi:16S rRNA U1498 N3-methylase RsmE
MYRTGRSGRKVNPYVADIAMNLWEKILIKVLKQCHQRQLQTVHAVHKQDAAEAASTVRRATADRVPTALPLKG